MRLKNKIQCDNDNSKNNKRKKYEETKNLDPFYLLIDKLLIVKIQ